MTPSVVKESKDLPETEKNVYETKETPPIRRPQNNKDITHQVSTCSQTDELYSRSSPQPGITSTDLSTIKQQMIPKLQGATYTCNSSSGATSQLSPRHIAMMVI